MTQIIARRFTLHLWLGAVLAVAFLLGCAVTCHCEEESAATGVQASDLTAMSIEELMNLTVVTAGKKPETISNTAAAVFVITSDDIQRGGYQTLAEAVRRISGFYVETDRYISVIGSRGYLPNGDLNRRVLVLVDGHKVNDPLYGQAPVDEDLPVDLQDIDHIEVVKGPGSALWGSEALLCVINCITKTAADINGLQIRDGAGYRFGPHIAYGNVFPNGLEVSAVVSELRSHGEKEIYFFDFDTPDQNNGVAKGLDGEHVGRGYLNMVYKDLKFTAGNVARVKNVPTAHWDCIFNTPGIDVRDERHYSELSFENQKPYAKDGKLFARVYHDRYDAISNWNAYVDPDINDDLAYSRGVDSAESWGAEARYSLTLSPRVSAILGAEYVKAKTQRYIFDVDPYNLRIDYPGEYTLNSYYLQTDWNVTNALRLVAGTRLDDHSIFGQNWSPRAGLVYKQSHKTTLKLLYGTAFRSPSMAETETIDNPNELIPESINTTELVWDQQVGDSGRLVTSLFGYDMYDVIRKGANRYHIRCRGFETQYDYRMKNGGSGYFGISLLNSKYTNTTRLLTSSPHSVITWGISMPTFGGKAFFSPDMQYQSKGFTNLRDETPPHLIVNATLSSSSLVKNCDISLGVRNLFNTTYYANAQPQNVMDWMVQPKRSIQLLVNYHL